MKKFPFISITNNRLVIFTTYRCTLYIKSVTSLCNTYYNPKTTKNVHTRKWNKGEVFEQCNVDRA